MLKKFIKKASERHDLTFEEMTEAIELIMTGKASDMQIAAFLMALKMKGETAVEIEAAAKVMQAKATPVKVTGDVILDTCGTGGDNHGTINISTAVSIIAAACGVKVAKHGNRSLTSKSGSADVLKELGVNIEAKPEKVAECIEKTGIGFIFAPAYHSAMKFVMPARKELGVRTIFNILGPIVNPARHTHHLMGVFDPALVDTLAVVLSKMGLKKAAVVCGEPGLDEVSLSGSTVIAEAGPGGIRKYEVKPEDFGMKRAPISAVAGGGPKENAENIIHIFEGKETGARRDIVLLNAGLALYIAGKAADIKGGIELARKAIESGDALKKMKQLAECSTAG